LSFGNPGTKKFRYTIQTLKGFANAANPFRVASAITHLIPGLPKLNPGLELDNTFGVEILSGKQEVVGLLHSGKLSVTSGRFARGTLLVLEKSEETGPQVISTARCATLGDCSLISTNDIWNYYTSF